MRKQLQCINNNKTLTISQRGYNNENGKKPETFSTYE